MKNYNELVRWSIKRDFEGATFKRLRESKKPETEKPKRIAEVNQTSTYAKFRRLLMGRLVRIIKSGYGGGYWVEFVNDADRQRLNAAAGWSNNKREFLLDGVKFKH